uniref:NADH-ubiquinone oxidoreductase chain 2 n=1 Tax=Xylomya moiwana TaxID=1812708 RepID=A0A164R412_9DIPT|nr:NADH dehydrogenase subunit 2 [Xylomya moiwana]
MFKNSSKILFFFTLILGTFITISSTSWLSAWMGLEINLLSFIPLMNDNNNLMSTEASLKYFLTQAIASVILLTGAIIWMLKYNFINSINLYFNYSNFIIISSLLMKSGTAPFHFWFPGVMEGLSWINALMLMTWQKIAPLMLISYLFMFKYLMFIIIISSIIGALGGLNQTSLRKLMAFSSINHLSWMITAMFFSNNLWFIYFIFYSMLTFNMIFFFNLFKLNQINQLFSIFFKNKLIKFILFLNLLSLGGLPPFLGFLPKWLVIQQLILQNQMFLLTIMTFMTLITLFFYLRLCYSAFMFNYSENNWLLNMSFYNYSMYWFLIFSFISIMGMFLISIIFMIF